MRRPDASRVRRGPGAAKGRRPRAGTAAAALVRGDARGPGRRPLPAAGRLRPAGRGHRDAGRGAAGRQGGRRLSDRPVGAGRTRGRPRAAHSRARRGLPGSAGGPPPLAGRGPAGSPRPNKNPRARACFLPPAPARRSRGRTAGSSGDDARRPAAKKSPRRRPGGPGAAPACRTRPGGSPPCPGTGQGGRLPRRGERARPGSAAAPDVPRIRSPPNRSNARRAGSGFPPPAALRARFAPAPPSRKAAAPRPGRRGASPCGSGGGGEGGRRAKPRHGRIYLPAGRRAPMPTELGGPAVAGAGARNAGAPVPTEPGGTAAPARGRERQGAIPRGMRRPAGAGGGGGERPWRARR